MEEHSNWYSRSRVLECSADGVVAPGLWPRRRWLRLHQGRGPRRRRTTRRKWAREKPWMTSLTKQAHTEGGRRRRPIGHAAFTMNPWSSRSDSGSGARVQGGERGERRRRPEAGEGERKERDWEIGFAWTAC